jgi:hypothetical protein
MGSGDVGLGGSLASGFITGVNFKIIIDSINQGTSSVHAAFRDSLGAAVPVYQGDTLALPASFQLYSGAIGFRVIIEGTPQIAGEPYLCDLAYTFTWGDSWGMLILENTLESCIVDQSNGLNETTEKQKTKAFPHPFKQHATIEFENYSKEPYNFMLYNLLGKEVKTIKHINSNQFKIEKDGLATGTYIFHLQNKSGIIATDKLVIAE